MEKHQMKIDALNTLGRYSSAFIVAAALVLVSGCANSTSAGSAVTDGGGGVGGGDVDSATEQTIVTEPTGLPFSHWPTCFDFNQLESTDAAIQLIGEAYGNPDLSEEEGWDTMAGVQDACAMTYSSDTSILRVLQDWQPDSPLQTVAWTATEGEGSWGGRNFPARVDDYRLVSEAEYAEFSAMYPGGTVCTFLGGALAGETVASDGVELSNVEYAKAYYTSSSDSMAAQGCDSIGSIISVTYTASQNIGFLADQPADSNGNHCQTVATNMCGVSVAGGSWNAADLSSDVPLDRVSGFLQTVMAAN